MCLHTHKQQTGMGYNSWGIEWGDTRKALTGQADEIGRSQKREGSTWAGVLGEGHAEGSGRMQFCEWESKEPPVRWNHGIWL